MHPCMHAGLCVRQLQLFFIKPLAGNCTDLRVDRYMKLGFSLLSLAIAAEAVRLASLRPVLKLALDVPLPADKLDFATRLKPDVPNPCKKLMVNREAQVEVCAGDHATRLP